MKVILALLALVALASASIEANVLKQMFTEWKATHNKVYQNEEEHRYRLGVFHQNALFVAQHDPIAKGFTVALNEFADLTSSEFVSIYNGMNVTKTAPRHARLTAVKAGIPSEVDWRKEGAVTPIKNQGQCGSCWSFSTTGSVEGAHFLKSKNLVSLSEQNLVDCSTAQGNMGCNGGLMDQAFQYIMTNNGIDTESSYPYTATGPNACKFNRNNVGATISNYRDVSSGSESALQNAVAERPVSVAIDASHMSFQMYSGGVYNEPACSSSQLDHGVLAIGYGTYQGTAYWLVKNSWGTSWGMSGYIMMSRNRGNQCGIATAASYPIA
jgi:cathepsin L